MFCVRCCIGTNVDDDFLKERWEFSFSRSRCLSNIKLPVLALILSFYTSVHPTTARYYWKLIFSLSFTMRELCRSSYCIKMSVDDDDDALICSTSPTFVAVRLLQWICVYGNSRVGSDIYTKSVVTVKLIYIFFHCFT